MKTIRRMADNVRKRQWPTALAMGNPFLSAFLIDHPRREDSGIHSVGVGEYFTTYLTFNFNLSHDVSLGGQEYASIESTA